MITKLSTNMRFMYICLIIAAICGSLTCIIGPVSVRRGYNGDFISYYLAGKIISSNKGGALYSTSLQRNIYRQNAPNLGYLPYRSTPFNALLMVSFSYLSVASAYYFWCIYLIIVLLLTVFILRQYFSLSALHLLQLITFVPVIFFNIAKGQQAILALPPLAASLQTIKGKHYYLAGLIVSLLLYRMQYIPVVLFFLTLVKNKRSILGFTTGILIQVVIGILISGIGWVPQYINFLTHTENPLYGSARRFMYVGMSSLIDFLSGHTILVSLIIQILLAVLMIFLINKFKLYNTRDEHKLSFAVIFGIAVSYHILDHDLVLLCLPFILVLFDQLIGNKAKYTLLLVLCVVMVIPVFKFNIPENVVATLFLLTACVIILFTYSRLNLVTGKNVNIEQKP